MRNNKHWWVVLVAFCLTIGIVGCNGSDGDQGNGGNAERQIKKMLARKLDGRAGDKAL